MHAKSAIPKCMQDNTQNLQYQNARKTTCRICSTKMHARQHAESAMPKCTQDNMQNLQCQNARKTTCRICSTKMHARQHAESAMPKCTQDNMQNLQCQNARQHVEPAITILVFRYPFHPRVTTVARKKSRSFCQKCRWQVTAKHAYTLRMWLCMKWHGAWLYGVHRTCAETAAVSCGTSHASAVSTPLRWIFKKRAIKASHSCRTAYKRNESAQESGE